MKQSDNKTLRKICDVCKKEAIEHRPHELYNHFDTEFFIKFSKEFLEADDNIKKQSNIKKLKKEINSMSNKELVEALNEFPDEQKQLKSDKLIIEKEIIFNQHIEIFIRGILAKRRETMKK